jgi:putative endonuclease
MAVNGDPRALLGRLGERLAADYLVEKGYHIIEMNYRSSHGEIDLIAGDGDTLVFVEVRSKMSANFGLPIETIGTQKLDRVRKMAGEYLFKKSPSFRKSRIDVIGILFKEYEDPEIHHLSSIYMKGADDDIEGDNHLHNRD